MGRRSKTPVSAIDGGGESLDRLRAALDASCVVGTWDWDIVRHVVVYDAGAARLLASDPSLAETEIRGLDAVAAVHPDDRDWLIEHVRGALCAGGLILAEYRVLGADGAVHWLLSRGRTFQDAVGRPIRSRGIIIDITELREGGGRYVLNDPGAHAPPAGGVTDLGLAADLAIALKRALAADAPAEIQAGADLLLLGLGRAIARAGGS